MGKAKIRPIATPKPLTDLHKNWHVCVCVCVCVLTLECYDLLRRRFAKRIYVPMPQEITRVVVLNKLLAKHGNPLTEDDIAQLAR